MKISEIYDNFADKYEDLINSSEADSKLAYNLKKVFDKYAIASGSILDVGCGPGNLKTTLGSGFTYTGIDFSKNMLLKAKDKGYKTIQGDIVDNLKQIPDKSFDYVVSVSVLHFVKDIDFVITEFNRISRKAWLISLADITENYISKFPITEPMYNHSKILIKDTSEDVFFNAWNSPLTGERISERMVFRKL